MNKAQFPVTHGVTTVSHRAHKSYKKEVFIYKFPDNFLTNRNIPNVQ